MSAAKASATGGSSARRSSPSCRWCCCRTSEPRSGSFAALGGIALAEATGDPRWDAVGSVVIGLLLIAIAIVLMIEMKGLLVGESASAGRPRRDHRRPVLLARASARSSTWKTQHIGPDEILVAAKVEFDAALSFEQVKRIDRRHRGTRPGGRSGGAADLPRARPPNRRASGERPGDRLSVDSGGVRRPDDDGVLNPLRRFGSGSSSGSCTARRRRHRAGIPWRRVGSVSAKVRSNAAVGLPSPGVTARPVTRCPAWSRCTCRLPSTPHWSHERGHGAGRRGR